MTVTSLGVLLTGIRGVNEHVSCPCAWLTVCLTLLHTSFPMSTVAPAAPKSDPMMVSGMATPVDGQDINRPTDVDVSDTHAELLS